MTSTQPVSWTAKIRFDAEELARAWGEFGDNPRSLSAKSFICRTLDGYPEVLTAETADPYLRLLDDRDIDPDLIARAGWSFLLRNTDLFAEGAADEAQTAHRLEENELCKSLLAAALVTEYDVERRLTRMRRWLLLSRNWTAYPRLTQALIDQTALNEGAWLIDDDELAALRANPDAAAVSLYFPGGLGTASRTDLADPVTRAVAEQYETWPYPRWNRVLVVPPGRLDAKLREWDPAGPITMPERPDMLIAGCGTGHDAALSAVRYPDARITAIDVSEASLHYAQMRCSELGISGIEFIHLDLHRLGELNRRFDAISCAGVLHHLPDPEKGWAALVDALKPAGALHIMVYSTLARLRVVAFRQALGELLNGPRDSETLRQIRRHIIERFPERIPNSPDFYTLTGAHDLLAHRHEDPFDVPRIKRAIDRFGLKLLRFHIESHERRARYHAEFPHDPNICDYESLSKFERKNPSVFAGMYDFWCRKQ